jgi:hypothetical protein
MVVGVIIALVAVAIGGLIWLAADQYQDDIVAGYARAPGGCVSTLDFHVPGRYFVFVETSGEGADLPGNCDRSGAVSGGVDPADVSVEITDPDGDEVDLDEASGIGYDRAGSVGEVVATIEVDTAGGYEVTASTADDSEFLVAIGRRPDDNVDALRATALALGLGGLIAGLTLLAWGARRRSPPPGSEHPQTSPAASWPTVSGPPLQAHVGVTGPTAGAPRRWDPGIDSGQVPTPPPASPPGHLPPPPPGPSPAPGGAPPGDLEADFWGERR